MVVIYTLMLTPQITPPSSLSSQTPPGHPEFVGVDSKYVCVLCNNVLQDAVQTQCGHRLCQPCVDTYLQDGQPRPCPYQEEFCEMLQADQILRDASARREIRQLPVYCSNKSRGCQKTLKWKELEKHLTECWFEPLSCPYKDWGCQEPVPRGSLTDHRQTCQYTPVNCQFCGEQVPKLSLETHKNETCNKIPIPCPFGCGIDPVPRNEMSTHQESCPKRPVVCKFASVGCTFQGAAEEMERHERQNTEEHIQQATLKMADVDLYRIDIRKEVQELSVHRQDARQKVNDIKKEIQDIKNMLDDVRRQDRKRKIDMVDLTERIIRVEKQLEEVSKPEVQQRMTSDLNIARENVRKLKDRLDRLIAAEESGGGATAVGTVEIPDPFADLQQQTRQLGLQEARLSELDIRFQILETLNYEGVLIWKITNYRRRKQDAVSGTAVSIYSSPFFTSRYGYKMCSRAYLNGDGMGKGTHFSIFFVVMQGEYDALLSWPFRQKVTFMILDQNGNRRHLSDSFRPDPDSSSFKRPLAEMNIASGCPLFVSHSILESSDNYIKDDCLFVKVMVDITGLNPI